MKQVFLFLLLLLTSNLVGATHNKLFILTGQSNSLGVTNGGETDPTSGSDAADANIIFSWHNRVNDSTSLGHSGQTIIPAKTTADFTTLKDQQGGVYAGSATHWGPEVEFARTLYRAGVRNFGVIKVSRGGGGNTFWHKGSSGHMYTRITTTVAEAVASLPGGDTYEIAGLLYLQGESDTSGEAAIAGTRVKQLTDNLRTDLANASTMHTVIGGITAAGSTRDTVRANQAAIASSTAYIDYFENIDLQTKLHDGLHYNKEAKITVGQRYAQTFFSAGIVSRHYGNLVFIGDSITQGGNGDHPSYRYQVFKNLANAGVPINATTGYKFVGSNSGGYNNSVLTTPDVNGQTFENKHDGHWGWRGFWINARIDLPSNRYNTNNLGQGTIENWTGQTTTFNSGTVTYTGSTYTPDTAVIMCGINDIAAGNSATQVRDDFALMIDQLQAANANINIFISQTLHTNQSHNATVDTLNALLPALATSKTTATSSVWVIETNTGFDPVTQTYDNVHPDDDGEEYLGDRMSGGLGIIEMPDPAGATSTPPVIEKGTASLTHCFEGNEIYDGSSYINGWSETTAAATVETIATDLNRTHPGGSGSWLDGTSSSTDGGSTTWNTNNNVDWTFETRLKINSAPNGFILWLGTGTDTALVYIYDDRTQSDTGSFNVAHTNNDGQYHTWRVAYNATTIKYRVWRDGVELSAVGGETLNTLNHSGLIMGDYTSGSLGDNYDVDIDYARYDQTGIYLPNTKVSTLFSAAFEGNDIYNGTNFINGWTEVTPADTSETLLDTTDLNLDHINGSVAWIEGTSSSKDGGTTTWNSGNNGDWTWEARMRINDSPNGILLWLGTDSDIAYVAIHNDRTENYLGANWTASHTNNDGEYHVWRVVNDSGNSKYHVWRDGDRLTLNDGAVYDSSSNDSRMIIGDFTGGSFGDNFNIDVDYICYDQTGAYLPTGADADSDGMPDSWEYLRFGDITSAAPGDDADNDGSTNLEEYYADTDATEASSRIRIESIEAAGMANEFDIIIPDTSPQRNYTLYESDDLGVSDVWTAVPGQGPTIGTDGDLVFTVSITTQKFYRVEVTIP